MLDIPITMITLIFGKMVPQRQSIAKLEVIPIQDQLDPIPTQHLKIVSKVKVWEMVIVGLLILILVTHGDNSES